MKRIAFRLFFMTLAPFILILILFVSISLNLSINTLAEDSRSIVNEATKAWTGEIDAYFNRLSVASKAFMGFMSDNYSLEDFSDLEQVSEEIIEVGRAIVLGNNLLNIYTFFFPEYVQPDFMHISVRNLKQDGTITVGHGSQYTRQQLRNNPDWEWMWGVEENDRYISDPYEWEGFDGKIIGYTEPLVIEGQIVAAVGSDNYVTQIRNDLITEKLMTRGYYALIGTNDVFIAHPDSEMEGLRFEEAYPDFAEDYGSMRERGADSGIMERGRNMVGFRVTESGWVLIAVPDPGDIYASVDRLILFYTILSLISLLLFAASSWILGSTIANPVKTIASRLDEVASGHLKTFNDTRLTGRKDELGILAKALADMVAKLTSIVSSVHESSQQIADGSLQISDSAQGLSSGAAEQAASAEEVSSSMEEMSSIIAQSADNSHQTETIAVQASKQARESGSAVKQSLESMNIIADKISVITEIARQTNLLALNAAIEAARAGESGKGFAVVASEVRKLAENSQKASEEIVEQSQESVTISRRSEEILEKLVPDIRKTAELVEEISSSSREQQSGVEQINSAIQQLDQVIQSNASSAEELASTSEELAAQASQLRQTMSFFKLEGVSHTPASGRQARVAELRVEPPSPRLRDKPAALAPPRAPQPSLKTKPITSEPGPEISDEIRPDSTGDDDFMEF